MITNNTDVEFVLSQPEFPGGNKAEFGTMATLSVEIIAHDQVTGLAVDPTENNTITPRIALASMPEEPENTLSFVAASWNVQNNRYFITANIGAGGAIVPANPGDYSVWIECDRFVGRAGVITLD